MKPSSTVESIRAFTPDELVAAYREGRRDFSRTNLLRAELEALNLEDLNLGFSWNPEDPYNPLWVDFRSQPMQEFEWDLYGRCLSVGPDDLPEARNLSGAVLSEIDLSGSYLYPVDLSQADLARKDQCAVESRRFSVG